MNIKPFKLILLAAFVIFLAPFVNAQNKGKSKSSDKDVVISRIEEDDELSVEIDMKNVDGSTCKMLELGDAGFIVYYNKKDEKKGSDAYEFVKFNNNFEEQYRKEYVMPKEGRLVRSVESGGNVYFLVIKGKKNFVNYMEAYSIVKFETGEGKFQSMDGKLQKGGTLQSLNVVNDVAYINVNKGPSPAKLQSYLCLNFCTCFIPTIFGIGIPQYIAELVIHDFSTKKQKPVNLGYDKRKGNVAIGSITINEQSGDVALLMTNSHKKMNLFWIKEVSKEGKTGKDVNIKVPGGKIIKDVRMEEIEGKKAFFGQYSDAPKKVTIGRSSSRAIEVSQGICFGVANSTSLEKLTMIAYSKINNFKFPMSKQESRSVKKKSKKGKDASINLQVHFVKPLQYNDEVILVGEVYYATYRIVVETYTDANGRMQTRTREVFDRYQFCNILVTSFNMKGELLWSNSVPYTRPYKVFSIYDRIKTSLMEDGTVKIVYNNGSQIMSADVSASTVTSGKKYNIGITKEASKKGTKVKQKAVEFSFGDIQYWYDDFYLATGNQRFKDKALKGKDKDRNFYFIKRVEVSAD